jgi:hypothetical protein
MWTSEDFDQQNRIPNSGNGAYFELIVTSTGGFKLMRTQRIFLHTFVALSFVIAAGCSDDDKPANHDSGTQDMSTQDTGMTHEMGTQDTGMTHEMGTQDTGMGPDTAAPTVNVCVEECAQDNDCKVSGAGNATCSANKRCVSAAGGCTEDGECMATYSGWATSCTTDSDCTSQVCIVDNGGVCATEAGGIVSCDTLQMGEYDTTKKDGGDAVKVCANTNYACVNNTCGCANDDACSLTPTTPTCNTTTGRCSCKKDPDSCGDNMKCLDSGVCGCASDEGCANTTDFTCDTDTGACKCKTNAACAGRGKCDADSGACVCDDASADCTADTVYDGTTFVCGSLL